MRNRFARILLTVTAILHIGFFGAAYHAAKFSGVKHPWMVAAGATILLLAATFGTILRATDERPRPRFVTEWVDTPAYVHWCACLFLFIPYFVALVGSVFGALLFASPIHWPAWTPIIAYGIGFVVSAYGILIRRAHFVVSRVDISIRDLPQAFDGYTLAHLSDLHIGNMTSKDRAMKWVRAVDKEQVDAVMVTGDMITNGVEFHRMVADVLGNLRGKDGVFACMGNHDYFGGGEPLLSYLAEANVRVLRNEGVVISRSDSSMYFAGVDDTWTRRADLGQTLKARPANTPCVLLAHDPELFLGAKEQNVDLTLSGHTHAGQVAVPFFGQRFSLSHLAHSFHVGIYREGRSTLYVHPGLGTTGPPIRIGTVPTVAILTLRREKMPR